MRIQKLITQADHNKSPQEIFKSIKRKALFTFPPAILLGFTFYRLTHQVPILIALIAATLLYTFYDIIKLWGAASQRRREVEAELPFTATLITIAANHSTPTTTLANTLHIPSLKRTSREYLNILKHSHLYHTTPAQAANKLADNHPSTRFQTFLRTISAAERGVGDPHSSLSDIAKAELHNTHHQTEIASEKLGVASSTVLMMFAVLPLTLTVFSLITNQPTLLTLSYITTFPSLILVNFLIEQAYPQPLKPHTPKPPIPLIIGSIAAPLATFEALRQIPLQFSVAASLGAFTLPLALYYTTAAREHSKLINTLPHLSRDIAEEAKKGSPPTVAMRKLITSAKYPKSLLLSLYDRRRPRPYIAQAYMDMLAESEKLGASTEELERVAETFNAIANTNTSYHSKSSFFKLTAYASAGILAAASLAVTTTIKKLSTPLGYTTMFTAGLLPHFTPSLQTHVYTAIIINSYLLGLLAGKAHTGSFPLGLLDPLITTAIATAILTLGGAI
ncbi:MAG TPA: hypothetical protein VKV31_00600 [bacterium]|nr:hypothetical protein [bacterium]